jgi:HAE1 family hydrophobic/amphiphilic exporter-1
MNLIAVSIRRPLTMLMIILGMVIIGARSYNEMQLERFPTIDIPVVSINVVWVGASPEDIEEQVVRKIEEAVSSIAGIDTMTGVANESFGAVVIQFQDGIDGNAAAVDVQRQVATIKDFPSDIEQPQIVKVNINAEPVLELVLNGPQSQDVLFDVADNQIKDQLQSIQGVSSVRIAGGREREIQVNLDPSRLIAYGLSIAQVEQALRANNITIPAGSLDEGRSKLTVRSVGEFETLEDIRNVIIAGSLKPNDSQGKPQETGLILLRDIATVQDSYKDRKSIFRFNGTEAVGISVVKTSGANVVEMVDDVRERLPEVSDKLPPGATLTVVADNSKFIRESIAAVQEDLISAVLITGMVILVFLHTVRSTFIVLMCLPTAIISNFIVMWGLNFTLDQITLLALTLVIGLLVDDSIVVLENIERHSTDLKEPPPMAAFNGVTEIMLAVVSMTLVTVVIYVPVAFITGIIGQIFYSYGITIATSVLFSMFVAFTLTPLLSAIMLDDHSKPHPPPKGLRKYLGIFGYYTIGWLWDGFVNIWEYGFNLLAQFYANALRFFLTNFATQLIVVVVAGIALAGGLWLVTSGLVGAEFIPTSDENKIMVQFQLQPGTNLDETDRVARHLEQIVLENANNEIVSMLTILGTGEQGSTASHRGRIDIRLVDKSERSRSDEDIMAVFRPIMQQIPETNVSLTAGESHGPPGAAIVVRIFGPDKAKLVELANQAEQIIKNVHGTTDVVNTDAMQAVETQFVIDRDIARDLGLLPQQVAFALRTALNGNKIGDFDVKAGTKVDLTLRVQKESRQSLNQLTLIPVGYNKSQPVTLGQVVKQERGLAPSGIKRYNRRTVFDVSSGVTGRAVGDVTDDIEVALNQKLNLPVGYGFEFTGSAEFQRDAFREMTQALGMSIILVYILLVALYQSFLQPLAIMFSLPVTLVGAFGGLYLTGNTLNLISLLGIILLAGIVTKNAILLVDFTNTLREEQAMNRKEALVEAGRLRLRAILMTTLTLVLALLPLLLGAAAGAELRRPMAAVVIGGMSSSTLLTLFLVPVVYNFFDWGSGLVSKLIGSAWSGQEDAAVEGSLPEPQEIPKDKSTPEEDPKPQQRPQQPMPQPG